jgi:hypothetical protein
MSRLGKDEDQGSAGAQSARIALLHPWNAAVTLPLSRSMRQCDREMVRSAGWLVSMLPGRLVVAVACHAARWVPQRGRA